MPKLNLKLQGLAVILTLITPVHCIAADKKVPQKSTTVPTANSPGTEIVIDMVVASVAGKPITLNDVSARLSPPRQVDLVSASRDVEARAMLDTIILEQLIKAESESRRISVSNDEIDRYIEEVAQRNQLTRDGFEKALEEEGRSLVQYKNQVQTEILKSRIANNYMKGGVTVSSEEIDTYLEERPELKLGGARTRLSQIEISATNRTPEELEARVTEVRSALEREMPFAQVAIQFSDGVNARDGGSLGMIAEGDLSPEIFEAIFPLKAGEISSDMRTPDGVLIFKVDERIVPDSAEDGAREMARQALYRQKLESGMQGFFESELYKRYGVDKKI